ncbi:hypothetical protein [Virgibacillus kimchii]
MNVSKTKIISILISMYFIMAPFYLLGSGLPQIADYTIFSVIILFTFSYSFVKDIRFYLSAILLLLIAVVNGIWSIVLTEPSMNINTLYFIFNIMIMLVILNLYKIDKENLMKYLLIGVVISLVIQFIIAITTQGGSGRTTLYFNNPNQLGYYSLIQLGIITLFYYINRISFRGYLVFSIISLYLILISLSSAAILSGLILFGVGLIYYFITKFNLKQKNIILVILVLLTMVQVHALVTDTQYSFNIIDDVQNRFESKTYDAESTFTERRYDRILENPQYWFTGAGQGGLQRFSEGLEIHASIPSFFFYYGILGLILLLVLFYNLIGKVTFITLLVLVTIHFYGLTHQGLRQSMFWILLAVIFLSNKYETKKNIPDKRPDPNQLG